MNNLNGSLNFNAGIDLQQWRADIGRIRADLVGVTNSAKKETSLIDSSFSNLGAGIATYLSASALIGFTNKLIDIRGEMQKTEVAFGVMLGSGAEATKLIGQMVDLAAKTPFSLSDVSQGAKQLLAFQVPAKDVLDTLTRMGNIASGLGVPIGRLNLVYGQVMAKGRLMGDDLRQFTEAGIPLVAKLAENFGKTNSEVSQLVTDGKVGFEDVKKVLFDMTDQGGMFFNLMEKQSETLSGKMSNLGDNVYQMFNKLGASQEGVLADGIDGLSYLVENYDTLIEVVGTLVATYGLAKAAEISLASARAYSVKTIQSEIASLGISQKMKLGRAMVTERQAVASLAEAQAENVALISKKATLQVEVSTLAVKRQKLVSMATEKALLFRNATAQLATARAELTGLASNATARQTLIATKNVEKAQNAVIATQETAGIARKSAITASTAFYTSKKELETTAVAVNNSVKKVEAVQELATASAKTVNAIATTRLTIAQRLQLIGTNALNSAQKALNGTMLTNPYIIAGAAIAALTYIIYKNVTATTAYADLQDKLKKSTEEYNETAVSQKSKLDGLIKIIKDKKTSDVDAKKALESINKISNNRIDGLTVEGIRLGQNTKSLEKYIKMLELEGRAKALSDSDLEADKSIKALKEKDVNKVSLVESFKIRKLSDLLYYQEEKNKQYRFDDILAAKKTKEDNAKERAKLLKEGVNIFEEDTPKAKNTTKEDGEGKSKKLAEIYSKDSLADLEQRISLWNEALQKASGNEVKVLTKDKFGDTKQTGQTISVNDAVKQVEILEKAKRDREKQIKAKNFDDELQEMQRQIKVRDTLLANGYSEETIKGMFPDVIGKDFLQSLKDVKKELESTVNPDSSIGENLVKVNEQIDNLTGKKTALEKFNAEFDQLKETLSQSEYIAELEFKTTETPRNEQENAIQLEAKKRLETEYKEREKAYADLLALQKTFEQKSIDLQNEYDAIKNSESYKNASRADKDKIDTSFATSARDLSLEAFKDSAIWKKAFNEIGELTQKEINSIIKGLQDQLEKMLQDGSSATDIKTIKDRINELKGLGSQNPFKVLTASFEVLNDKNATATEKLNALALGFKSSGEAIKLVGDAFGGLSDSSTDAIDNIVAIGSSAIELGASIAKGDVAGMIKAGIALIGSLGKALNGDQKKERAIKKQAEAVKKLESAYKDLKIAADKAFGSDKYSSQTSLIKNLEKQNQEIREASRIESSKKKIDNNKLQEYKDQQKANLQTIESLKEDLVKDVLQTDLTTFASKIGDALVDAFSRGEDGVKSLETAANDMLKNLLKNQLNLRLQDRLNPILNDLFTKTGLNKDGTGTFKGLSPDEIKSFQNQVVQSGLDMKDFLQGYSEIFGGLEENPQGLKGDIKGVSEQTAGALEGQINSMRINQVSILEVARTSLLNLIKIEFNTSNLIQMRIDISEMNSKIKKGVAGIG
jgi:tape measure domain-containing protein